MNKKNILIIGKFHREAFGLHIFETLLQMGHIVHRYDPGYNENPFAGRISKHLERAFKTVFSVSENLRFFRELRIRALWDIVDDTKPNIILVCHDFLWPSEVSELKRRSKAQVAMWFPDHIANFNKAFFMIADYDALFFKDPFIVYRLSDVLKTPTYYVPECFNPVRHAPPQSLSFNDMKYDCDIATVGNLHTWRVIFFQQLIGYDVRIWSPLPSLWLPTENIKEMLQGRGVYDIEKAIAFLRARIVVNNLHYAEIWGVNARCFEAAGAGAFQLVTYSPGINSLFEDGRELVTFQNISDLKKKIDYWLPREDERQSIALAGMRRAYAEHTYKNRLENIISTLEGQANGFQLPRCAITNYASQSN